MVAVPTALLSSDELRRLRMLGYQRQSMHVEYAAKAYISENHLSSLGWLQTCAGLDSSGVSRWL